MPDRRPLYLVGNASLAVTYLKPALRVSAKGRAPVLFPLPQVSRVVSRGDVSWSGPAISACLEHAVPVLFVDSSGRVQGSLFTAGDAVSSLGDHLAAAVLAPEWSERFENWRCSQERRLILILESVLGWQLTDLRPSSVRKILDRALAIRWSEAPQRLLAGLVPCMRATVDQRLASAGVPSSLAAGLWGTTSLAADIARLASWPLRGRLLQAKERPSLQADLAISYYERHFARPIEDTVDRLVRRLWQIPL